MKSISSSRNGGYGADSGPSRADARRGAFRPKAKTPLGQCWAGVRPFATSRTAIFNVRFVETSQADWVLTLKSARASRNVDRLGLPKRERRAVEFQTSAGGANALARRQA